MRKVTKALAVLPLLPLALALQGCGSDSKVRVTPPSNDHLFYEPGTYPRFDPGASDLPFNNDLIFLTAASTLGSAFDGTANIGAATDPVRAALNSLDGFSTNAPFDILIQGSLDPATVMANVNVFLVRLQTAPGGEQLDPGDLDPANPIAGALDQPSFSARVISLDGGTNNAIRITPLAPLAPKTKYLVFLNNAISPILDSAGEPVTRSWAYNALTGTSFNATGSLATVRQLINGWEQLAAGFLQVASMGAVTPEAADQNMTVSYSFTTTDPTAPLLAMAAPRAALVQAMVGFGISPGDAVGNVTFLQSQGYLSTPIARDLGISAATAADLGALTGGQLPAGVGNLYTGYIKLPYYLRAPQQPGDNSYTQSAWQADPTLGSLLSAQLPEGTVLPPVDVDGMTYNVTYRYPFAGKQGVESVPLQVTLPEADHVPGYAGAADCGQIYAASGYPVAVYVHGITSDRSSVIALGHTLASNCVATVAIDLPLHGVDADSVFYSGLNVEANPAFAALYGVDAPRERFFNDAGGSGAQFINLAVLTNTRDNLRQGVMDLLNLNASLPSLSAELSGQGLGELDTSRVYMVGASLGSMVGSVAATVGNLAIGAETAIGQVSNITPYSGVVLSVGGTQLTQILLNSNTFGPVIIGGLAAAGVEQGTTNFERFIYAAQSTVDSGDPVSFAAQLGEMGVPVLLQQVNGDAVVPNAATDLPLAGTAGLATLTGAAQIGAGSNDLTAQPGIVKLEAGSHSSLLTPDASAPQVTAEMQAQVVTFILNNGTVAVGSQAPGDIEAP